MLKMARTPEDFAEFDLSISTLTRIYNIIQIICKIYQVSTLKCKVEMLI